jgi:hypothetical protein
LTPSVVEHIAAVLAIETIMPTGETYIYARSVAGTEHRAYRRFRDFVERYAFLVPKNDREEI